MGKRTRWNTGNRDARTHIVQHHRARPSAAAGAQPHWGAQQRATTDEDPIFNHRAVLARPIIVAHHGGGADIHVGPNRRIAYIANVMHLGPRTDTAILDFTVVADLNIIGQICSWPQMGERAYSDSITDNSFLDNRRDNPAAAPIREEMSTLLGPIWQSGPISVSPCK